MVVIACSACYFQGQKSNILNLLKRIEELLTDAHATPLQKWLKLNNTTHNQLAKTLGVSPHTVKKFAIGDTVTINRSVLHKIALLTDLSYQELIDPARGKTSPIDTGCGRINVALGMCARYLHTREMAAKCRRYFSLDFFCTGKAFSGIKPHNNNFDEMCALNALRDGHLSSSLLSVGWYDADCETNDSRTLHTYWRTMITNLDFERSEERRPHTTFLVIVFDKSINEMQPLDLPIMKSWWWDSPIHTECRQSIGACTRPINELTMGNARGLNNAEAKTENAEAPF